jgi:hypothetical protein
VKLREWTQRHLTAEQNSSRVANRIEFRDASLPGYELGSLQLNWVKSLELAAAE